jgi:ubiquinone/menaquinone biosynthesis C-methylase UbiE
MRLSGTEFIAMNNPVRNWILKHVEFRIFRRALSDAGIDLTGSCILDAGCGGGYSTKLIYRAFNPSRLVAFDLMPEQIEKARTRGTPAEFSVGDVTRIDHGNETFDAAFVFGILHHVVNWRGALNELARVLRREGVLLVEEPERRVVARVNRYLRFSHPEEAMFTWPEFIDALKSSGFGIIHQRGILGYRFRSFLCRRRT